MEGSSEMDTGQSRREFLKSAAAAGLGLAIGGRATGVLQEKAQAKATVVVVRNADAQDSEHRYRADVVKKMVFEAVRRLSGESTDKAAWSRYFKPSDVVGIKLNCLFGMNASTHPEVAYAVAEGIQLAGVKPENIILWDRSDGDLAKSGYEINRDGPGIRCYGTNGEYEENNTQQGSFNGKLTRILTERITALANVPILKDHGTAGVTIAFKNHYGTCNNPGAHHGNNCDPYLADLNNVPAIKDKTRLVICDAIRALCNGGPGLNPKYLWDQNCILAATDPVALDYVGWRMIEDRRKEVGLPSLADAGRPVRHLATAEKLGLGIADPARISMVTIG
jgi:uncharacterized protein (DUF362 family)